MFQVPPVQNSPKSEEIVHTGPYAGPLILSNIELFADIFFKYPLCRRIMRVSSTITRRTYTAARKMEDLLIDPSLKEVAMVLDIVLGPKRFGIVVFKINTVSYNSCLRADILSVSNTPTLIKYFNYQICLSNDQKVIWNRDAAIDRPLELRLLVKNPITKEFNKSEVDRDMIIGTYDPNVINYLDVYAEYFILRSRCRCEEFRQAAVDKTIKDFKYMVEFLSKPEYPVCYLDMYLCINGTVAKVSVPKELYNWDKPFKKMYILDQEIHDYKRHFFKQVGTATQQIRNNLINQIIEAIKGFPW